MEMDVMKRVDTGTIAVFFAGVMTAALGINLTNLLAQTGSGATELKHWLAAEDDARRDQLEHHLRGLDVAMFEIGHRFNELYYAGQDRNWPYAQYQVEKVELALRLALERRPARAASARPFVEETIPFMKDAIKAAMAGNATQRYDDAMDRLRTDCMKCHVAENVPHFTVRFPQRRESAVRPAPPK
jgi:hypothetical protein